MAIIQAKQQGDAVVIWKVIVIFFIGTEYNQQLTGLLATDGLRIKR